MASPLANTGETLPADSDKPETHRYRKGRAGESGGSPRATAAWGKLRLLLYVQWERRRSGCVETGATTPAGKGAHSPLPFTTGSSGGELRGEKCQMEDSGAGIWENKLHRKLKLTARFFFKKQIFALQILSRMGCGLGHLPERLLHPEQAKAFWCFPLPRCFPVLGVTLLQGRGHQGSV